MFLGEMIEIKQTSKNRVICLNEPFDLLHCISECLEKVLVLSNIKHLELLFRLDNENHQELLTSFSGDKDRVQKIVVNLL